ncbi:hypothetical protein HanRHA438_Chr09g0428841 [Helianthus annuus]|nr:hypothetical protein HanIR_Chr09g0449051 [Helianthus annuus]KAJ0890890.1 hypothetical protein HanRHA438_Chr09g0428841 [Helianthus annuus]
MYLFVARITLFLAGILQLPSGVWVSQVTSSEVRQREGGSRTKLAVDWVFL